MATKRVIYPGVVQLQIPIIELMQRLHRPGMSDARTNYQIDTRIEYSTNINPEKESAKAEDIQITIQHADLLESSRPGQQYEKRHIARLAMSSPDTVAYMNIDSGTPYFNGERLRILATTPLED